MRVKNLIVGGGFAGLYLASLLEDAVIVEASPHLGGLLRGFKSPSGEFTFDVGGHVYTTKDELLTKFMRESRATYVKERKAYFDFKRKVGYPLQYHANQLGIEVKPNPLPSYVTLDSLLRHEFGHELYERVLRPFNRRVWSTDPSAMSSDWVMGRVAPMKDKTPNWGPNGSFYYAMGGDILETLRKQITETKVYTSTWLDSIDYEGKVASVRCTEEGGYSGGIRYEYVYDTSGLLLNRAGYKLPHNDVLTLGVALDKRVQEDFHWWYNGTDNKSPVHRVTLLSRYHEALAPKGCDSLLIEIPHGSLDGSVQIETLSQKYWAFGVMSILREANFNLIEQKDILEVVVIKSKGYPIPILGHRDRVAHARANLIKHKAFLVGRWGAHGYYNLDHIMKDAYHAVQASKGVLTQEYVWANYYYHEQRRTEC